MRFQLWLPPRQMYRRRASTTGDISRPEIRRSQSQQMWVKAYAEDGFVIVPNLQGADTLDRLRQAMGRIMKDPKGVPEDLRHKILYERTHVAKYREWHNGIITGTPCVRSRICRLSRQKLLNNSRVSSR
jgi:hypothetical protein